MAAPPHLGSGSWESIIAHVQVAHKLLAAALAKAPELSQAAHGHSERASEPTVAEPEKNVEDKESLTVDAADFLLSNSQYHDCYLTVGNPAIVEVERIGVASVDLIAHSPVFREMLTNHRDIPDRQTCITDVSPATFKLMLRFIYGGKLPKMSAIESAGLALCADKFMIPRLVRKALKRLKPTGAEDVFPALICVTYANFPDLETQVCKIIQQETDKVVGSADFLKLDEASVIFILKQDTLKIYEVELWEHVVRWAEHQVEKNPTRTVRDCLTKILGYVRFFTFTSEEILDYVLPTKALSSDEYVDLSLAVRKNQPLESHLLCNILEKRKIYQDEEVKEQNIEVIEENIEDKVEHDESKVHNDLEKDWECTVFDKQCCFTPSGNFYVKWRDQFSFTSSLTITAHEPMEIESFICDNYYEDNLGKAYYCCNITVENQSTNFIQQLNSIIGDSDQNLIALLPLKFNSGLPIKLNPEEKWKFTLSWEQKHAVYHLESSDKTRVYVDVTKSQLKGKDLTVIYDGPFHAYEIYYRKQ